MLTAVSGDIFTSRAQTLVNTVNCVGVMGKGIALEFKKRYPAMFEDYVARCRLGQVRLGEPYLFRDLGGAMILNFPTKDHWRSPSRLKDIDEGLEYFASTPPAGALPASLFLRSAVETVVWRGPKLNR
jgi:hypothetical protein